MTESISNGECISWFENPSKVLKLENLRQKHPIDQEMEGNYTKIGTFHQINVLLQRGVIKAKRDMTLTHLRIIVNIVIAAMLGGLFVNSGNEGSRVLDNYNLLFVSAYHYIVLIL